jgi:hypothetical protein
MNEQNEVQMTVVKNEQRKVLGNYVDLENRFREIMQENKFIKNELSDLR